jgi:hypothetical protein
VSRCKSARSIGFVVDPFVASAIASDEIDRELKSRDASDVSSVCIVADADS